MSHYFMQTLYFQSTRLRWKGRDGDNMLVPHKCVIIMPHYARRIIIFMNTLTQAHTKTLIQTCSPLSDGLQYERSICKARRHQQCTVYMSWCTQLIMSHSGSIKHLSQKMTNLLHPNCSPQGFHSQ